MTRVSEKERKEERDRESEGRRREGNRIKVKVYELQNKFFTSKSYVDFSDVINRRIMIMSH